MGVDTVCVCVRFAQCLAEKAKCTPKLRSEETREENLH